MAEVVTMVIKNGKPAAAEAGDILIDGGGNRLGGQNKATTRTRVKTTANIADLAAGAPNTVDGISLSAGDRVLVAEQSTANQNGLYKVDTVGTGANGAWSRTTDMNENQEINELVLVMVEEGDKHENELWSLSRPNAGITIGTDAIIFVKESRNRQAHTFTGTFFLDGQNALTGTNVFEVDCPVAGYLTAASVVALQGQRTAGTLAIEPHVNGTGLTPTGLDLLLDATDPLKDKATLAYETSGAQVAANDRIGILATSSSFAPTPNSFSVTLTVEADLT